MDQRKKDHLDLTKNAQAHFAFAHDARFNYEPLWGSHQIAKDHYQRPFSFLGKTLRAPLWISSMTGGTGRALEINQRLARVAHEFGLGMGLGSCRPILDSQKSWEQFNLRPILGDDLPFYANLGICQIEKLVEQKRLDQVFNMVEKLSADGLIVHLNPLQEWAQKEGDFLKNPPLETIEKLLSVSPIPIMVKEVGQGMGPKTLHALWQMPIAGVELAAFGGTNFTWLETLRHSEQIQEHHAKNVAQSLAQVGHTLAEMVMMINQLQSQMSPTMKAKEVIISGGVKNFLDGHYWRKKLSSPSIYGQAFSFIKVAEKSYEELQQFVHHELQGLAMAEAFLSVKI
jgi:isopentenyl-diphosphate delta-isomerase